MSGMASIGKKLIDLMRNVDERCATSTVLDTIDLDLIFVPRESNNRLWTWMRVINVMASLILGKALCFHY
jgi:hypothetical protein